jgi:5-methylcytosine-specific restriction enzyme subunit McrC
VVRVQNLYYLLCYAWDHADLAASSQVAGLPSHHVADLLGHVLSTRVAELLRRGLHREYVSHDEELRSPRGKIDVSTHIKRVLGPTGRAACVVDELDHDVLMNRLVRTALERLASAVSTKELARALHNLSKRMPPVSLVDPTPAHFARLRLHRMTAHYRFVLHLCELIFRCLVPERGARWTFVDFTGDERAMGLLFESFVRNYLAREQHIFRVDRDRITWPVEPITSGSDALLPEMHTDITLTAPGRRIIVETKFYAEPLRTGRGGGTRRLREAHLYQLFAYLRHMEDAGKPANTAMLLYAASGERFDHRYRLGDQEIRACALDLDQPWEAIAHDLTAIAVSLAGV